MQPEINRHTTRLTRQEEKSWGEREVACTGVTDCSVKAFQLRNVGIAAK